MEVSGQLHDTSALLLMSDFPVRIGEEAGWDPEPIWTRWLKENIPVPAGN